ncbi:sugar transferase [Aquimarina sp. 2201CG5-10]|uniref:sugar transferase n=1 Tax=Aquimarina callyspongiae TaxID=3098150 RepID=UPI002AB401CE|nr:sugar transferase [Aquimarina sp. 2201CG5-10]MDY8136285.1 sugar transferase [Aquimarina sp. 2201CG5-10]
MYTHFLKKSLDVVLALILLVIISPVFFIIIIVLSIANNGNPFFVQKRPGKNEKIFSILKFKTMNDKVDKEGNLLPDKDRLTSIGKFVRKTSLDEIPQLINVVKGDMSFIGPRPLLIRYLPYYTPEEKIRHSLRPGITGLAQVSGRNLLNWNDRLAADVSYVQNVSLLLDIKIIIRTIKNVITSKDIAVDPNSVIQDLDEYRRKN